MSSFNYGKIRTTRAVLVAISIPIFTTQLEKSRESTDAANLRAAYATASVAVLESDTIHRYNLKGEKKGEHFIGDDSKQIELLSQHSAYVLGVSEIYKIHI